MISVKCIAVLPVPLPDDPKKWDGWSKYKSPNPYERLCLDPRQNPSNELIEEHCRELLRWWQKKLPLKNQPSNPVAQLLRTGLDESSRYLTEARVELLDPVRRQRVDEELAALAQEEAIMEFHKFLAFSIADGLLTSDEEKTLYRFGAEHGLSDEQVAEFIEKELEDTGSKRFAAPPPVAAPPPPAAREAADPKTEFARMLRLSGLDTDSMTDDQRDAFINMAENLGVDAGEAEDMVDDYLDQMEDSAPEPSVAAAPRVTVVAPRPSKPAEESAPTVESTPPMQPDEERRRFVNFTNSVGGQMYLIPSGTFRMGSTDPEAAPNEGPVASVTITRFYIARFVVTNGQFEQFDQAYKRKRAPGTCDRHPAVHVTYLDAARFCQWLSGRERRKYRLPTEAEWEYAGRGLDGRKFPWGDSSGRGDLANFADKNTVFAWSDREIDDGYAESAPVGSFPRGVSPFGVEDMAGNVWEWCSDFFQEYKSTPRTNPRGPNAGTKRVYRGGSWKSRFASLRVTARNSNLPNYSCNDLGFRVVCECEG